ncbi:MAG: octaprenyl diphosphate synthase, partial [Legionella sp.]|nr:octaprenyl diphosphate synthase [Legionella sp.]
QQTHIREALTKGSLDALPNILDALQATKAIEYTKSLAEKEVSKAKKALDMLPDSPYKKALIELAEYAILRSY